MEFEVETKRLILKVVTSDSAHMVLNFYEENKDFFEPWDPKHLPTFYTTAYHSVNLNIEYNQIIQGKFLRYFIFLKDNPSQIIGSVCFQNFLRGPYQNCTLGYKISQAYSKQGYGYEAIQTAIDLVFSHYGLHRIEAYVMPDNLPSIGLLKKLSFDYEGIAHSYAMLSTKWCDFYRYALINKCL